jgi:hypothetical protein
LILLRSTGFIIRVFRQGCSRQRNQPGLFTSEADRVILSWR